MKQLRNLLSPYILAFILPVAIAALLAGGLNLVSFLELRDDHRAAMAEAAEDQRKLRLNRNINNDIASIQEQAADLLEQSRAGKIDQGGAYRIHAQLVDQLAALEKQLVEVKEAIGAENMQDLQRDFSDYRSAILRATDLAVIDPASAIDSAYRATRTQQHISQQVRKVAAAINEQMAQRSEARDKRFQAQAIQNAVVGGALVLVLILAWVGLILRLSGRLITLTSALDTLSKGEVTAQVLSDVRTIASQKVSLFRALADAVLSFHASNQARHQAQQDLDKRMRELTCLYDVMALTEDPRRDLQAVLQAVAERLPAAMRYPEFASAWVRFQGRLYGRSATGAQLQVSFGGTPEQPDGLGVTYSTALPAGEGNGDGDGAPFLAEEQSLLEALATRVGNALSRRQAERALEQADRALRTARECGQLLIHAQNEDALMQDICRLAVEVGGYRMAWVGFAEHDEARTVRLMASAGFEDDYLAQAQISWADVPHGRGPAATAIREQRIVVARDIRTDAGLVPWRDAAVQRGVASMIGLPLVGENGQCMGALSLYAQEADAFDEAEVELLGEMANDLSFGIRTLRTRQALNANVAEMRKLSLVVEQSPNSIFVTDLNANIEYVNDAFTRNTGFSREEVLGKNARLLQSGKTPEATYQNMWAALGRGETWVGEFVNRSRAGKELVETAIIIPIIQADGGVSHYVAIKEDITEKKRMEDELERHRAHLEQQVALRTRELDAALQEQSALFEAASVGIVRLRRRVILRCNRTLDEMMGYAIGEQVGQNVRIWYPDELSYNQAGEDVYGRSSLAQVHTAERELVRKDGSRFWARMSARAIDAEGVSEDLVCVIEDITQERTAIAEIRQAHALAESANRSKSDFLANMSHEIRTPMNAIIGMSHLALLTSLDKKQRNYIEKVKRAGENLLGIINDILDFSKIEAGKMGMETVAFQLEDVMDHLANLVGMKTEDKGLELLFSTAPDVPSGLVGDPLRLGQVLINLANNAAKFTDKGEVVVGIEKVADLADGVELHFWVRDTGIGMTPEQCQKMFQSFSQADASTTRKYGGTGLGLAISKSLVEAMQGKIWVDSVAGQGSTFHFHARFGVQAEAQSRTMLRADELLGVRVLVVDDNAAAREILSTMAKTFGLEVDVAYDGPEALRMLAVADQTGLPYDLVLMDWKMPGMDGVDTVRQLGSEQLSRTPVVIMVTAYGREDALSHASNRGLTLQTVLTKPVNPSTLLEAIGEALGKGAGVITRKEARVDDFVEATQKLKGARVLLVEDNDMNQELAIELLGSAGLTVVLAQHGQEALDILARDPHFDGVLMDCQMPVMDGYTATQEIRKQPAFKDLPIIAMTANAMASDKEKVLEAGMWDHIAKPLNLETMFATLAKWIHPAHGARATPLPAAAGASPAATAQAPGFLNSIALPGIDTRFGLKTMLNKESLYLRMLLKFRDGQQDFAGQFAQALASADASAAQRCAHTLCGMAGTIGAKRVQDAAHGLELACKQQAPGADIDALLQKLLAELQPVIDGLQQLGEEKENPRTAPVPAAADGEKLTAFRARLHELLERGDSGAIDLCEQKEDLLAAAYPQHWKRILDSVTNFDFEAALAMVAGVPR